MKRFVVCTVLFVALLVGTFETVSKEKPSKTRDGGAVIIPAPPGQEICDRW